MPATTIPSPVALFPTVDAWLADMNERFAANRYGQIDDADFRAVFTGMAQVFADWRHLSVKRVKGATYPVPYTDNLGLVAPAYRILGMQAVALNGTDSATGAAGALALPIYYTLLRSSTGDVDALLDGEADTTLTVKAQWVRTSGTNEEKIASYKVLPLQGASLYAGEVYQYTFSDLVPAVTRLLEIRHDITSASHPVPTGLDSDPNYKPFAPLTVAAGYDDTPLKARVTATETVANAQKQRLDTLLDNADPALDVLKEIGDQLRADEAGAAAILATQQQHTTRLGQLAPKADPVFMGNPTAPTAPGGDSSATLANTQFVQSAIAGQQTQFWAIKASGPTVKTDFALLFDAVLWAAGGFGAVGGYVAINRPISEAQALLGMTTVLNARGHSIALGTYSNQGLHLYSGAVVIHNQLLTSCIVLRAGTTAGTRIQGGSLLGKIYRSTDYQDVPLILDGVQILPIDSDPATVGAVKIILRNGAAFVGCAPGADAIITVEPAATGNGPTYTAGNNITISAGNVISAGSFNSRVQLTTEQGRRVAVLAVESSTVSIADVRLFDNAQALNFQLNKRAGGNWQPGAQASVATLNNSLAALTAQELADGVELEAETIIDGQATAQFLALFTMTGAGGGLVPLRGSRPARRVFNANSSPEPQRGLAFNTNGATTQSFSFQNPALAEAAVVFWFKRNQQPGTGNEYWFVGLRPANLQYFAIDSGGNATNKLYVEGVARGNSLQGSPVGLWVRVVMNLADLQAGNVNLYSGQPGTGAGPINAEIFDLRFYSRNFTPAEIADRTAAPTDSLIARYSLPYNLNTTTATVPDESGNGRTGTLYNF